MFILRFLIIAITMLHSGFAISEESKSCQSTFINISIQEQTNGIVDGTLFYINASGAHGYSKSKFYSETNKVIDSHQNYERPSRIPVSEMDQAAAKLIEMGYLNIKDEGQRPNDKNWKYYFDMDVRTNCNDRWVHFYSKESASIMEPYKNYLFDIVKKYHLDVDEKPAHQ